jgi:hypothetical protein
MGANRVAVAVQVAARYCTQTKVSCKLATGFRRLPKVPCKFAARFRQLPKVSCRFATRFPSVGKSPAGLRQGFQVLESLLQVCDKVSKGWKVSCIVTAKNSKKRERGIKDFELVV